MACREAKGRGMKITIIILSLIILSGLFALAIVYYFSNLVMM